jgi:hypothetical protein
MKSLARKLPITGWKCRTGAKAFPQKVRAVPKATNAAFNFPGDVTVTNSDQEKKPESIALHLGAIILGVIMMVLGVGLSVTMVLLPIGIPLGLVGLGVFILGMTPGWRR